MIEYFPGKRKISQHLCFIHNGSYFLVTLTVYEGGKIECWGIMDKQEFLEKVKSGWITVDIPDDVEVRIGHQDFVVKQGETLNPDGSLMFKHKWITNDSFVMDVLDSIDIGMNNESASKLCYDAFQKYENNPTEDNKKKLYKSYFDVPEHNRRFILGDQDLKDSPIRGALGL